MDFYRIETELERDLLEQPESGMGYQILGDESNGRIYLVFNATVAVLWDEFRESGFSQDDYQYLSSKLEAVDEAREDDVWEGTDFESSELGENKITEGDLNRLDPLTLGGNYSILYSNLNIAVNLRRGNDFYPDKGAFDSLGLKFNETAVAPPSYLISPSIPRSYYRFSTYVRDKRVDNRGFRPGTYATTYSDLHFVPSGYAAVGRYALPNPASARFVYQIVTQTVPILIGTATPNFGQAGGGVEVLFGQAGAVHHPGQCFEISAG
jgi:hypothetical protein